MLENFIYSLTNVNAIYGVYWGYVNKKDKIYKNSKEYESHIIKEIDLENNICLIELDNKKCNNILNSYLDNLYSKNPYFYRIDKVIDFDNTKQKEIKTLLNYISQNNEEQIDICLYKTQKNINYIIIPIQDDNNKISFKYLFSYMLTEDDIDNLIKNKKEIKGKIITNIKRRNFINNEIGIRYTIEVKNA